MFYSEKYMSLVVLVKIMNEGRSRLIDGLARTNSPQRTLYCLAIIYITFISEVDVVTSEHTLTSWIIKILLR